MQDHPEVAIVSFFKEGAMKIPEHLRIPAIVFTLEAVLLIGCSLVFFVLIPT